MTDEGTDHAADGLRTRRQVLRSTAAATATAGVLDTAAASADAATTESDDPTRTSGLTRTGRTTEERRLQWTARHRNHYELDLTDNDRSANIIWQGISDTTLRLVDATYQPFGNPVDDADDPGCWRYTFSVGSVSMCLVPFLDTVEYDDETGEGTVTEDRWMLADRRLPGEYGFTNSIQDTIRVMGPDPNVEDGEVNPKLDAVAIGARRSPELFSIINGDAVVESIRDTYGRDEVAYEPLAEKLGEMAIGSTDYVGSSYDSVDNYAVKAHRASHASKDLKTTFDLGRGFLGLLAERMNWTTLGDDVLGPIGAVFDMKKLGESVYELAFRDAADRAANWQGFEVSEESRATGPISGHQYVFDIYVAPGRRTAVTVESEHALGNEYPTDDSGEIETLANPKWTVRFDAPQAPEADASLTHADKFDSASLVQLDAPNHTPQHAWPAINVQSNGPDAAIGEWPVGVPITFDAYDTALSDSRIVEYKWTVESCNRPFGSGCTDDRWWVTEHESNGRVLEYLPDTHGVYRVTLQVTEYSGLEYRPRGEQTETTMRFNVYQR